MSVEPANDVGRHADRRLQTRSAAAGVNFSGGSTPGVVVVGCGARTGAPDSFGCAGPVMGFEGCMEGMVEASTGEAGVGDRAPHRRCLAMWWSGIELHRRFCRCSRRVGRSVDWIWGEDDSNQWRDF